MARWLSFFAEYDFWVEYKPGRLDVVADALSLRPDYAVKTADANRIGVERVSAPSSSLIDDAKAAYASDADAKQLLSYASAPSDEARLLSESLELFLDQARLFFEAKDIDYSHVSNSCRVLVMMVSNLQGQATALYVTQQGSIRTIDKLADALRREFIPADLQEAVRCAVPAKAKGGA
ncbi:hypothetical protein PC123_g13460 [Phytophthora cactorum]|nr:hypothetical protein PC123_g13460 [Phytophthora cactorum]